jgi:hypothetical protein
LLHGHYHSGKIGNFFSVKPPAYDFSFIFRREKRSDLYCISFHTSDPWSQYSAPFDPSGGHFQYFHSQVLMSTVLENQSYFPQRDIDGASLARDLMGKLGICTLVEAKRVIYNMLNCKITVRDIDNADVIYGSRSYRSLSGNAKWKKSPLATLDLAPRVQQQQQQQQ